MNEKLQPDRFLSEAFSLVATYLYSDSVSLTEWETGGISSDDTHTEFAQIIRVRHAIACAKRLLPLLRKIETRPSTETLLERSESRGAIKGRLDVPKYLARRVGAFSWPRTYPVIINSETLNTPENSLAIAVIRQLLKQLSTARLPAKTAERHDCDRLVRSLHSKSRSMPWREVSTDGNAHRKYAETRNRVRRRQTGNDEAYLELCNIVQEWKGFPEARNHWEVRTLNGLVAFPSGDFFLERIFEIWLVQQVANALDSLGSHLLYGPNSLQIRSSTPIYTYQCGEQTVEVWFQQSLPKNAAVWKYRHSGQFMRGIPDLMLHIEGRSPMLIDAKYRMAYSRTRAEETYKMLGYFENFRSYLEGPEYHACLVFLANDKLHTILDSVSDSGQITLLGAHPTNPSSCSLAEGLREAIQDWLG